MAGSWVAYLQTLQDVIHSISAPPRPPLPKEPPVPDAPPTPRPTPNWAKHHAVCEVAGLPPVEWWQEYHTAQRRDVDDKEVSLTGRVLLQAVPTMAYWEGRAFDAEQALADTARELGLIEAELAELRKQHDNPAADPLGTVRTSIDDDPSQRIVVVCGPYQGGPDALTWCAVAGPAASPPGYTNDEVRGWPVTGVVPGSEADQQAQQ